MRPEYDRAVSTCASPISPAVIAAGVEHKSAIGGNAASAVAGWAIAVRARGFRVRLGRTMRLSALLPLLGYRQLAWTFISGRCGSSRGRKDGRFGSRAAATLSGHHENRWSEVHPEANLRDHYRSTTALCHRQPLVLYAMRVSKKKSASGLTNEFIATCSEFTCSPCCLTYSYAACSRSRSL
jgi:hypothetical protein